MEKKMESEMGTGITKGFMGIGGFPKLEVPLYGSQ